jgi:hypothetical protein
LRCVNDSCAYNSKGKKKVEKHFHSWVSVFPLDCAAVVLIVMHGPLGRESASGTLNQTPIVEEVSTRNWDDGCCCRNLVCKLGKWAKVKLTNTNRKLSLPNSLPGCHCRQSWELLVDWCNYVLQKLVFRMIWRCPVKGWRDRWRRIGPYSGRTSSRISSLQRVQYIPHSDSADQVSALNSTHKHSPHSRKIVKNKKMKPPVIFHFFRCCQFAAKSKPVQYRNQKSVLVQSQSISSGWSWPTVIQIDLAIVYPN